MVKHPAYTRHRLQIRERWGFESLQEYQLFKMKKVLILSTLLLGGCTTSALSTIETNATTASWYSQGVKTASGAKFNPKSLTAAHKTLPFGTLIKVTNLDNDKTVVVMVNDRGPFIKNRGLDVSKQAAIELGFLKKGVTRVTYTIIK